MIVSIDYDNYDEKTVIYIVKLWDKEISIKSAHCLTIKAALKITKEFLQSVDGSAKRGIVMRRQFVETDSREDAIEAMPWACTIVKVDGGYRGYESIADYNQDKKQK